MERRSEDVVISNLQNQLLDLQRQNKELIAAEQAARRKIEASEDAFQRKLITANSGAGTREYEDLRRHVSGIDNKVTTVTNDINGIRNQLDRQANDLIHINNEMRNRPVVDPSKIANSTQQLDGKVRDLHSQITQLKQTLEQEITERSRETKVFNER
uniref:Uncharacterized protein n=1 Tax=Heterorhabditis bacteriophora TaxID=37862 RepID=A0A1I7X414_HETBA